MVAEASSDKVRRRPTVRVADVPLDLRAIAVSSLAVLMVRIGCSRIR